MSNLLLHFPRLVKIETDATDIALSTTPVDFGATFQWTVPQAGALTMFLWHCAMRSGAASTYTDIVPGLKIDGADYWINDGVGMPHNTSLEGGGMFFTNEATTFDMTGPTRLSWSQFGLQFPNMDIELAGVPAGLKTLQMRLKNSANAATTMTLAGTTKTTHIALGYAESL